MKKIAFLFVAVAAMTIASCGGNTQKACSSCGSATCDSTCNDSAIAAALAEDAAAVCSSCGQAGCDGTCCDSAIAAALSQQ